MFLRVVIGCDHAAVKARGRVVELLKGMQMEVVDCGVLTPDRVDYPDVAETVIAKLAQGSCGILICGSGIGMSIAANKIPGVRAALCHDHYTAKMARQHNNANLLCMGARTTGPEVIAEMVQTFLQTDFEGGRHAQRVDKMMATAVPAAPPAESAKVIVACDHAAFEEKADVVTYMKEELKLDVLDLGVHCGDRVDYPDMATALCQDVLKHGGKGILMCGSGLGVMMTANRCPGIRAALCHEAYTARMSRQHNNANVLCLGARTTGPDLHKEIVSTFFSASFEGGRHANRVEKLSLLDAKRHKSN